MAYVIGDDCIACGTCIDECPAGAISEGEKYSINVHRMRHLRRCLSVRGYQLRLRQLSEITTKATRLVRAAFHFARTKQKTAHYTTQRPSINPQTGNGTP